MEEIKSCPFCGSKIDTLGEGFAGGGSGKEHYYYVVCPNCMISNNMIADMQIFDKNDAIAHWNTRVKPEKIEQ